MTFRDVPDELHSWLKNQAAIHHRSVNKEIIAILESFRAQNANPRARPTADCAYGTRALECRAGGTAGRPHNCSLNSSQVDPDISDSCN
jgi:plasmid stability protein